jgi:UDP-N-acetylmuramate: L-alanyl-gamma-D-glutamyl-meso-diaminopimelate ligase
LKDASDFADAHLRVFDRPPLPDPREIRSVYLIGICGTGMGSLAGLLREAGYAVSGSDADAWPPMSTRLRESGIHLIEGFDARNLDHSPDLVIVGNACTPTHPEAARARDEKMVQLSFPEAFAEFFLRGRKSLVVAGTHGKTTTSGLLVHAIRTAGLDPTYLVGGVMLNGDTSFGLGNGGYAIVEGDEYDSAYFDKKPKFMHYRPSSAIVTSMEFDHADIYDDWDDYRRAFERFVALIPSSGSLVLNADDSSVLALAQHTGATIAYYGLGKPGFSAADASASVRNLISAANIVVGEAGFEFDLLLPGRPPQRMLLPATGRHNLSNALAVAALCWAEGLDMQAVGAAFANFRGMKRRQEVIGVLDDVIVIDDFAHHPTAVDVTIRGVRERWPSRRLVAVFEPRSNSSRRKVFEAQYVEAFSQADIAMIALPPFRHNDDPGDFMDVSRICEALAESGVEAFASPTQEALRGQLEARITRGDILLVMSNGGFDGLHDWLLSTLRSRHAETLCRDAVVIDAHIDAPSRVLDEIPEDIAIRTDHGDFDFVRARAGGLDAAFMVAYVPATFQDTGTERHRADTLIDFVHHLALEHPDKCALALSPADIRRNHASRLLSLPIAIENGAALEGDLANVEYFWNRGARYITLTHSKSNAICDSSYDAERRWGGLSPFGREVVAEMNRVGMMIDISHATDEASIHVVGCSTSPVVATHSCMRAYTPGWERNMSDAILEALAQAGGLVMINFGSSFLSPGYREEGARIRARMSDEMKRLGINEVDETGHRFADRIRKENPVGQIADVVRHIHHAVTVAGIDHVGIGSDFDGVFSLPAGLQDVSGYPKLVEALLEAGYDDGSIRKILGENLLRVWGEVERRASASGVFAHRA